MTVDNLEADLEEAAMYIEAAVAILHSVSLEGRALNGAQSFARAVKAQMEPEIVKLREHCRDTRSRVLDAPADLEGRTDPVLAERVRTERVQSEEHAVA
ncbi:MAG: hypothetical protein RQ745_12565 [Longimicrobiales bacterium]|nr:hypothetical protein [Longimicrobiales bacterium]